MMDDTLDMAGYMADIAEYVAGINVDAPDMNGYVVKINVDAG